jgi:cysteine desulfurase
LGAARAYRKHGKHVVTSTAEHKATLETLKLDGFDVSILPVDKTGAVSLKDVLGALRPDTILVSVIYANNEVGTMNPVMEIGRGIMKYRRVLGEVLPLFHVDIAQAVPYIFVDVEKYKIDLASFSAAKMFGPKGIGALYVRRGTAVDPLYFGGGQENAIRPGTENVPGIVGFGAAASIAKKKLDAEWKRLHDLRSFFIEELQRQVPDVRVNGNEKEASPHILNVNIKGIDVEEFILRLDAKEVYASAASACTNSGTRSHVLKAMGFTLEEIRSSVRFSFGRETTKAGIIRAIDIITDIVSKLRK